MKKKMQINGQVIEVKKFVTRQAALNHISKKGGSIVFFKAHEYYVSLN